jgi:hypothetical protein
VIDGIGSDNGKVVEGSGWDFWRLSWQSLQDGWRGLSVRWEY